MEHSAEIGNEERSHTGATFTSVFIDGKVRSVLNPVCRNPYMKDQEPVQNDEYA